MCLYMYIYYTFNIIYNICMYIFVELFAPNIAMEETQSIPPTASHLTVPPADFVRQGQPFLKIMEVWHLVEKERNRGNSRYMGQSFFPY